MREKIRELFEATGLGQILLFNSFAEEPNFHYFTGLPRGQFQKNALVLRKGKKPLVLTSFLWSGLLEKRKGLKGVEIKSRGEFLSALKKALPGKKIGISHGDFSHGGLARLKRKMKGKKFTGIGKEIEKARETKTKNERKKVSKAVKITERALSEMEKWKVKGMREKELALRLEMLARESGAEQVSFPLIVASGKNASVPHHVTSNKKIEKGLLLVDFGARYKNYCADLSRVYFVGKANEKSRELYSLVWETKKKCVNAAGPGIKARALFKLADKKLEAHGGMVHALGHGIGLRDHDFPAGIGKKSNWKLRENMCLAIEPAVYGKFGGIRIEDNYIVKKSGLKALSKAPKELIELK